MCLARSTPHTGSSGAQGLWSEFTAKPQLAAPKGSTGPPLGLCLFQHFWGSGWTMCHGHGNYEIGGWSNCNHGDVDSMVIRVKA